MLADLMERDASSLFERGDGVEQAWERIPSSSNERCIGVIDGRADGLAIGHHRNVPVAIPGKNAITIGNPRPG